MRLSAVGFAILSIFVVTACGALSGLPGISPVGDTTSPAVDSTVPAADATVPVDAVIAVTFTKPMNTRSVTITAQPPIAFGVGQWSTEERTVTFRPEAPLSLGTSYTITVAGKDRTGNTMSPSSWKFRAGAPGARAGTGEVRLKDKMEARADVRLFTLFAALNAAGYEEGAKESGPVRDAVREKLGDLALKVVEPVRRFRADHPQPPEAYISYVLSLTAPPQFAEQRAARGLDGLNRILAQFYADAKVADLWQAHSEAHAKVAASLATGGLSAMGKVLDYMRVVELPVTHIILVPNLLDAPGASYLIHQRETATFILGSTAALDRVFLTRLVTRLLLPTGSNDLVAELQRTESLHALVKDVAAKQGYGRWEDIVRESLVAAVTAHLALSGDQREKFLQKEYAKGLLLVDSFTGELTKYESSTLPLTEFVPQMLRAVNLDEVRLRFAERRR